MRKFLFAILFFLCFFNKAKADHITGGEIYYSFSGMSGSQYKYHITVKIYMVCNTFRDFNNPTYVSIFNRSTKARIQDVAVNLGRTERISLSNQNPCITNPPTVCYRVGYYDLDVILPASAEGYILSSQVIYRVDGMINLVTGYDQVGATYTAEIPGTANIPKAPENNSAVFTGSDLVVVCANNSFSYSFAAKDADGDELTYSFCNAYQGGSFLTGGNGEGAPAETPPYSSVPYSSIYSGSKPLGNNVNMNSVTGLITGIAPPTSGVYVITVCVTEIRNGVAIAIQRKDLQINITSCSIAAATIPQEFILCGDDSTIQLANYSTSPLIKTYDWQLINSLNETIFTSTNPAITYSFPDTGTYKIKLVINSTGECADSATATAKVYPGFAPAIKYDGICFNKPTQFTDATTSTYGEVNFWQWDFGDAFVLTDQSQLQNPSYQYTSTGSKNVQLITSDTKGCIDTVYQVVSIVDKPPVQLAFADTLICKGDELQMQANGNGNFVWTPANNIINANSSSPTVSPQTTTTYYVEMNDNGCINTDSVIVNVADHVEIQAMNDTTICTGDAVQLNLFSNALHYLWSPSEPLNNANIQQPLAVTNATTIYSVTASIGGCTATEEILVKTVPYPVANAGVDTIICYNSSAQLNGSITGSSFLWSPTNGLTNAALLNPATISANTTTYVLYAYDNLGCPKPGIDSVIVTVLPSIVPYAGRDTSVVINQPLQLTASGGSAYSWFPPIGLSAINIANPVAIYMQPSDGILYKVNISNEAGCIDSAFVTVKVFKTLPSVFVPTAFTPNADGKNDILKPIAAGMQRIEFFSVYNRWGQIVYHSTSAEPGWNGAINGIVQTPGTFVWMVKAIDYTGKPYFEKGTVTLIR